MCLYKLFKLLHSFLFRFCTTCSRHHAIIPKHKSFLYIENKVLYILQVHTEMKKVYRKKSIFVA